MRLATKTGGYTWIRNDGADIVPVHRLVAYAHGHLESLDDPRDVHHLDGLTWRNSPDNLFPIGRAMHCRVHLAEAALSP